MRARQCSGCGAVTEPPPPPCDIPSGCCSFTGPWTVTRSSLRMLRRVAAFCRPLRPLLLLVSFPRSRSPVVGVPGLCWLLPGSFDCFCCPHTSVHRPPQPKGTAGCQVTARRPSAPHVTVRRVVAPLRGPWTVTRSSLRMLRRVAAFCRPLRPVLPLVSFPRSRSPVVGVPGLCWLWRDVPFAPPPPLRRGRASEVRDCMWRRGGVRGFGKRGSVGQEGAGGHRG